MHELLRNGDLCVLGAVSSSSLPCSSLPAWHSGKPRRGAGRQATGAAPAGAAHAASGSTGAAPVGPAPRLRGGIMSFHTGLLGAGFIAFVLAAAEVHVPRVNLTGLGLALVTLGQLL